MSSEHDHFVDVAGAPFGGAGRFRDELEAYLKGRRRAVTIGGTHNRLTPGWIAQREYLARRYTHRVALNNVSFFSNTGLNTVLLRNVIHFSSRAEMAALDFRPSPRLAAQVPIVRFAAKRADRIIVPCTAMRDRVEAVLPSVRDRLQVRMHPVAVPAWSLRQRDIEPIIFVPVVPNAYKNLSGHISALFSALDYKRDRDTRAVVTCTVEQLGKIALERKSRINCIGTLLPNELVDHWATARAIYYPTSFEAFGYPLAEARAGGKWVIAPNISQYAEIAGEAHVAYEVGDTASLATALEIVNSPPPLRDEGPFDPDNYFDSLFSLS